jgi:hypothetical protein
MANRLNSVRVVLPSARRVEVWEIFTLDDRDKIVSCTQKSDFRKQMTVDPKSTHFNCSRPNSPILELAHSIALVLMSYPTISRLKVLHIDGHLHPYNASGSSILDP